MYETQDVNFILKYADMVHLCLWLLCTYWQWHTMAENEVSLEEMEEYNMVASKHFRSE